MYVKCQLDWKATNVDNITTHPITFSFCLVAKLKSGKRGNHHQARSCERFCCDFWCDFYLLVDVNEMINLKCVECMFLYLSGRGWFTRSHLSKGENRTEKWQRNRSCDAHMPHTYSLQVTGRKLSQYIAAVFQLIFFK
jgi:hypothetical protein